MANTNRTSGRQAPTSQSGRAAAATGSSGRIQPAGSGRMAPAPSGSGRSPAASGRSAAPAPAPAPAPSRASGRAPAAQPSRQQMAPAARSSRRGPMGGEDGRPIKKKIRGSPALLYCFGGLALLGVIALAVYFSKSSKIKDVKNTIKQREEIFESNMSRAKSAWERAHNAGLLWVIGKEPGANPEEKTLDPKIREKLFGSFQSDDKVYNVIMEWNYKDKKQKDRENKQFLYPERLKVEKIDNTGKEDGGLALTYGFAENRTIPVVIAEKRLRPTDGDTANTGGLIMVIVKAEDDYIFQKARQAKARNAASTEEKK